MPPEAISKVFAERLEIFERISRKPIDTDLHQLTEALTHLLLRMPYDELHGIHKLVGLIMDDATYIIRYAKVTFPRPTKSSIYDDSIDDNATGVKRAKGEAKHRSKIAEGIPDYRNALDDAKNQATRAKNPITDDTLVMIATDAMLSTQQFPRANDDWENLDPRDRFWEKWKAVYKAAAIKEMIKKKAAGGQD